MAAALQHSNGNFADVFHVEAPLFHERQSSGKGLASSDAQVSSEKWLDLVLLILGGVIALAAPLVSCAIGHESDITANTWDQCWNQDDPSVSSMFKTPVGSAYLATGLTLFYSVYFRLFYRIAAAPAVSCQGFVRAAIYVEAVTALVCVTHPFVYPLRWVHRAGFGSWVVSGIVVSYLIACNVSQDENQAKWVSFRGLFVLRSVVFTVLAAGLLIEVTTSDAYSYGQFFLLDEYFLLFLHILFGILICLYLKV